MQVVHFSELLHNMLWQSFHLMTKVLENSRFLNFEKCREHEFTMVEFFEQRFPDHLQMSVEEQEKLQEQFIDYQLLSNDNISQHVWDDATVKTDKDGTASLFRII